MEFETLKKDEQEFVVKQFAIKKSHKPNIIKSISSQLNIDYNIIFKWYRDIFSGKSGLRYKDLSEEQIQYMNEIYWDKDKKWDERINELCSFTAKSERTVRKWCSEKLNIKKITPKEPDTLIKAKEKNFNKDKKRFIITCAQNATKVHLSALKNMEAYAEHIDAEILIIPIRYHNPTSLFSNNDKDQEWWDDNVVKYLSLKRHKLNNYVTVLSDIKTQPTSQMPLSGFESIAGDGSAILAHPRMHMRSLPTLGEKPKLLFTTGICTKENYTDTKTGKIGEFHHTLGFVIVEIDDTDNDKYYIRQVSISKDGSFNDLIFNVSDSKVSFIESTDALIKGDIHYGNHDVKVIEQSFNRLIPNIKPKQVFLHDVFDGYSINHHEEKNFVANFRKEVENKNSLKDEIDSLLEWLESIKQHNIVIVFSNHDDFLNRFIINGDFKKNIKNALSYMEYAQVLLNDEAKNGLISYIINKNIPEIKTLGRDDSYIVNDWELAVHGMDGINGSRGSINQYKRLNTKIVTAHAHSVCRIDGAVQVGTNSKLKMGYNHGMSSWVHSDVIIHSDGKAQHILYMNDDRNFTTLF